MDIKKEVIALISEQLNIKSDKIKTSDKFIEDLKADSLDVVEIVMTIEEKFELSIPDESAEKLQNIQDLINYIEKAKKA